MSNKITTIEFAERVDLTAPRILQLILMGVIEAEKFGRDYMIYVKRRVVIKNRPEGRGRKVSKKAA